MYMYHQFMKLNYSKCMLTMTMIVQRQISCYDHNINQNINLYEYH